MQQYPTPKPENERQKARESRLKNADDVTGVERERDISVYLAQVPRGPDVAPSSKALATKIKHRLLDGLDYPLFFLGCEFELRDDDDDADDRRFRFLLLLRVNFTFRFTSKYRIVVPIYI